MKKKLNVAIIGTKFMGKAHSNAWRNAPKFYDLPYEPVLKVVCARDAAATASFAENWDFPERCADWLEVVRRDDIDIVDICTPTDTHSDIAVAAANAGKQIFCEKPCAMSFAQAKKMAEAADKAGVTHYLNHNYRRVPAVVFAKRMVEGGMLGDIYHWRGAYLQDWIMDPNFPLIWQLQKERAGAGPHFDLNSHAVDLARFIAGEIKSVSAMMKTFVKKRPLPGEGAGTFGAGKNASSIKEDVNVDDASFMTVEFENGALGSIDATRFAGGRKNYNHFEIYGSKGSLCFNMERMNELEYMNLEDPADEQGFRTIQTTNGSHPYMSAWWAPGHIIGYEHTFIHAVKDFLEAMKNNAPIYPNLWDGARIMQVLEAGIVSDKEGRKVLVDEIK
jgi:predicted dehydrogenase